MPKKLCRRTVRPRYEAGCYKAGRVSDASRFHAWYMVTVNHGTRWMNWFQKRDYDEWQWERQAESGYERMVDAWASLRSLSEPWWAQ